jgi:hypothetical protein
MRTLRTLAAALCAAVYVAACAGLARAERPASRSEFAAVNRTLAVSERSLHTRLRWVHVSTAGPFALAYLTGGQTSAILLRGSHLSWRGLAAISDEGLRCGLAPAAVIEDLQLDRYNDGPKPCSRSESRAGWAPVDGQLSCWR